jgi:glycosyltransferase involved in cell wall biosynthesis
VLFVGSLVEGKGVKELLEAFAEVAAEHPAARLLLAGEGALEHEIEGLAGARPATQGVVLLGRVDHDDVPRLMDAADVLALPSHAEGLPVCLMEAAAMGLPVVATDVGGSAEVARLNPLSRVVPARDPKALATALGEAIDAAALGPRRPDIDTDSPFSKAAAVGAISRIYSDVAGARSGDV